MEEAAGGVGRGGAGRNDDDGEERAGAAAAEEEVKVYCAVGKDAGKEWRANLRWVLANFPRGRSHGRLVVVLAHVHRPPRLINMMGAWVPASRLAEREVAAYRKLEVDRAKKALDDLLHICKTQRVHASKVVVVSADDASGALLRLVEDHGVAELVMGAAADRAYTRERVVSKAQSGAEPSTASTSPRPSSASDHSTSKSSPLQGDDDGVQPFLRRAPGSNNGTDGTTEDSSGHEAAAETAAVAEAAFLPEPPSTPSRHGPDDAGEMEAALHEKLMEGIAEARKLRQAAYEDTRRRELDAIPEKAQGSGADSELQATGSERAVMDELDVRMSESCPGLDVLRLEEPAPAEGSVAEVAVGGGDQGVSLLQLRLSELVEATNSFDKSARIGGDGWGRGRDVVYRGTLRGMSVAVKIISPDVAVHRARFAREADTVARARHPGLVTLVGACPDARAVVEELVPGGSLEDRLGEGTLPWHARCGVAYRTCSALAYLHSTATVHGDVRPANILFEDERCSSSKLAGLGTSRLAAPKRAGSLALAYVDPRYLATGELTPQCDVHALGVLLLRLVTGKPASAAKKAAREAATGRGRAWREVVDASAGGWPMERATEVAILGLKCCAVSDGRVPPRPAAELLEEARRVLESVTGATPGITLSKKESVIGDEDVAGSGHGMSPMTNMKLAADELVPSHAVRAAISKSAATPAT